ncbi:MAG: hypothetical protein ACOX6Q_03330 [Candidatus Dojkabacteria bacterium]|jgi:hypothetical protein
MEAEMNQWKQVLSDMEEGFFYLRDVPSVEETSFMKRKGFVIDKNFSSFACWKVKIPVGWSAYFNLVNNESFDLYDDKGVKRLTLYLEGNTQKELKFHSYLEVGFFLYPYLEDCNKWVFVARDVLKNKVVRTESAKDYKTGLKEIAWWLERHVPDFDDNLVAYLI